MGFYKPSSHNLWWEDIWHVISKYKSLEWGIQLWWSIHWTILSTSKCNTEICGWHIQWIHRCSMDAAHHYVIEASGIFSSKAVIKWQAQTTAYKTKVQFITDFNMYHKEYRKKLATTTPITHYVQQTNTSIDKLRSIIHKQNTVINQINERVDSIRDETSVIPLTVVTQPLTTLQHENQELLSCPSSQWGPNYQQQPHQMRQWWWTRRWTGKQWTMPARNPRCIFR